MSPNYVAQKTNSKYKVNEDPSKFSQKITIKIS